MRRLNTHHVESHRKYASHEGQPAAYEHNPRRRQGNHRMRAIPEGLEIGAPLAPSIAHFTKAMSRHADDRRTYPSESDECTSPPESPLPMDATEILPTNTTSIEVPHPDGGHQRKPSKQKKDGPFPRADAQANQEEGAGVAEDQ